MYPGVELRLFRYVVAVAEELHFSRAALRVHVTQPSLSKQIRELEDGIGVRLFDRTNRRVQLTNAGRVFVKEAAKALVHSERAVDLARHAGVSDDGPLLVGYSPRMNLRILSIVRSLSLSRCPGFKLGFVSSHTHDQVQGLLEGSIHAGLITLPVRNESLAVNPLVREPLVVVLSHSHPLAGKPEVEARELNGMPVIARSRRLNPTFHDHLHRLFKRVGYTPNVVQEVTVDGEALYMVREGLGIAFIKASDVPEEPGELFYCRLREPSLAEETGIAHRRDNRSKALGSFVGLVRNRFRVHETGGLSLSAGVEAQDLDSRQLTLF